MKEGYNSTAIGSLDELSSAVCIPKAELTYLSNNLSKHVRPIVKKKKSGKPRYIISPSKRLTEVLQRLKVVFFDDYAYPDYVYGLGGNSLMDHARVHMNKPELVQADLTDFFPSINHTKVYEMWLTGFSLPSDVARVLTKLCTYSFCLQQGFATSSHIAAIVAKPLTHGLYEHCVANHIVFSQYVDDLNFSGAQIDKRALFKRLVELSRKCDLSIKKQKTTVSNLATGKIITGVALYNSQARAPRPIRQKAFSALKELAKDPENEQLQTRVKGYHGYLTHMNKHDGENYQRKINNIRTAAN